MPDLTKRTLDPANVRAIFAAHRATQGAQFVSVDFIKKSGEWVTRNGLTKAACRRVGNDRGYEQGARMAENGQLFIDSQDKTKRGASFMADKVTGIRICGEEFHAYMTPNETAQAIGRLAAH